MAAANTLNVTYSSPNPLPVNKQELFVATTQSPPVVIIPPSSTMQTLIMFDVDSSQPDYIHWMVTDIPASGGVAEGNNTVWPYMGPAPTAGTGFDVPGRGKVHRYYFALFNGTIPKDKTPQIRGKFQTKAFQEQNGLEWTAWNGFWVIA
jgi:phosphatidylethanolamine-binding protein (PEBP) family uncharacterized protein